jgi:hypothetical protein
MLNHVSPFYEVAIVGNEAATSRATFGNYFIPNKIFIGSSGRE